MTTPRIFSKNELAALRTNNSFPAHVALASPRDYSEAARNYHLAAMRLLDSLDGRPADDLLVAPALVLYRQGLELLFKSVFQQKHYLATGSLFDKNLVAELKKISHSLDVAHGNLEQFAAKKLLPAEVLGRVGYLVEFLEEESKQLESLRYGGKLASDELEPFALDAFRNELRSSWVAATAFTDVLISSLTNPTELDEI